MTRGRKIKYTPEFVDKFCDYIEMGMNKTDAGALLNVSESRVYDYLNIYPEFRENVAKAEARLIAKLTKTVVDRSNVDHDMALKILKTKRRADWSENVDISIQNKNNQPFIVATADLDCLTTDTLDKISELVIRRELDKPE